MKMLSPQKANTNDKVCSLNRDNTEGGDFWMLSQEETVNLTEQSSGATPTASITMPKATFDKLIRWYMRPQKIRSRKP